MSLSFDLWWRGGLLLSPAIGAHGRCRAVLFGPDGAVLKDESWHGQRDQFPNIADGQVEVNWTESGSVCVRQGPEDPARRWVWSEQIGKWEENGPPPAEVLALILQPLGSPGEGAPGSASQANSTPS
jgi:hypothetical protein